MLLLSPIIFNFGQAQSIVPEILILYEEAGDVSFIMDWQGVNWSDIKATTRYVTEIGALQLQNYELIIVAGSI